MDREEMDKLQKELEMIAEKYNVEHASFCGSSDQQFIGFAVSGQTRGEVWETVLNVGRLWQFMREQTRQVLNSYEPKKNW